jgi:hypothetical protein
MARRLLINEQPCSQPKCKLISFWTLQSCSIWQCLLPLHLIVMFVLWPVVYLMAHASLVLNFETGWCWDIYHQEGDVVWCHDYHLMCLPKFLKDLDSHMKVGWFLHTPFPSSEIYRTLPLRSELLKAVLTADLIGCVCAFPLSSCLSVPPMVWSKSKPGGRVARVCRKSKHQKFKSTYLLLFLCATTLAVLLSDADRGLSCVTIICFAVSTHMTMPGILWVHAHAFWV